MPRNTSKTDARFYYELRHKQTGEMKMAMPTNPPALPEQPRRRGLPWWAVLLIVLGALGLLSFCCVSSVGMFLFHPLMVPANTESTPVVAPTTIPSAAPVVATAIPVDTSLWTPATCASLSAEMGIPLTVLTEGNGFTACVYTGPIVEINIPHFTVVDADRGNIEVWVNSTETVSLEAGNMTFRQWNGKLDSACAQVQSLDEYLQTLEQNLHATAGNFACPIP